MTVLHLLWVWGGHALALLIGIWALWRGTKTERYGAIFIWLMWVLSPLLQTKGMIGLDYGLLIVDAGTMLAFFWLSATSRKFWTAFAAAFMVLTVAGHFSTPLSSDVNLIIYLTNNGFWGGYAMLGALAAGMTGVERSRKAKSG
jgi:hypothetical protein